MLIERIFNSLIYRVELEISEWKANNEIWKEYAYPWYHTFFIKAGEHPVRNAIELCFMVLVWMLFLWVAQDKISVKWFDSLKEAELQSYFLGLWAAQIAISALIYPIVIGFVSMMLQRRHTAKARLHIFFHDSAAIATGFWSLSLVLTMAIQFIFMPQVERHLAASWLLIDAIWFVVNVAGVMWFLARTFDHLRPAKRAELSRSYAMNVVLVDELRNQLTDHFYSAAPFYKWLEVPHYGAVDRKENAPSILLGGHGMSLGKSHLTIPLKIESRLVDVSFFLLDIISKRWEKRALQNAPEEKKSKTLVDYTFSPTLIFPLIPGQSYKDKVELCRIEGTTELDKWERFLLRFAFKFPKSKRSVSARLSIKEMFDDLSAEVLDAVLSNEENVFNEALSELKEFHVVLLKACACLTPDGAPNNYAILPDRNYVLDRKIHQEWGRVYLNLFNPSLKDIAQNSRYFELFCHVPNYLFARAPEKPVEIRDQFIGLAPVLYFRLEDWWNKIVEDQGMVDHGICSPCLINPPYFTTHEAALKSFVAAWESLKNYYFMPKSEKNLNWDDVKSGIRFYEHHINSTLYMLFSAVSRGDSNAADWMTDVLLKWWDEIKYNFEGHSVFLRQDEYLTIELLTKEWDEAREKIDVGSFHGSEDGAPKALFAACLENYWVDTCSLAICMLIQWGKDCECSNSLPARLISMIIKGKPPKHGGSGLANLSPIKSANELLTAIFRQYVADGGYRTGYREKFDKVVEDIAGIRKPGMVSGRIYSGWGGADYDSLRDGQMLLLCLLVADQWKPEDNFKGIIQQWVGESDASVRDLDAYFQQWIARLDHPDFQQYESIFICIKEDADEGVFATAIGVVKKGIESLLGVISSVREQSLNDLDVSQSRLEDVARWSSELAFSKDTAAFPVAIFKYIQSVPTQGDEHFLTINKTNKGEFTDPEMVQRANNEDSWFAESFRDYTAGQVMAGILRELSPVSVDASSPDLYWQQIKRGALDIEERSLTPILLVDNPTRPDWLWNWSLSEYDENAERPEDLRMIRDKNLDGSPGYQGSLNDIAVYNAPLLSGASFLIARESLDVVKFTAIKDSIFVQVEFSPVPDKPSLIDLHLKWAFETEIKDYPAIKLNYVKDNLDNEVGVPC
jgi:hypothetical protein